MVKCLLENDTNFIVRSCSYPELLVKDMPQVYEYNSEKKEFKVACRSNIEMHDSLPQIYAGNFFAFDFCTYFING